MKIVVTGGSGFIGTNLIDALCLGDYELINADINPPKKDEHSVFWRKVDIMNEVQLQKLFDSFRPDFVVHLAARTDTDSNNIEDYAVNSAGTDSVIKAILACSSVRRTIFTSTQFVNQYGGRPKSDLDFSPHTTYGESKVLAEQYIRRALMKSCWTIIRPTNIWGAWHPRYPFEFWLVLAKGLYIHPSGPPVIRSYGYVKNVCWQIQKILEADEEKVNGKVFYVGDNPIDLKDWVNGFSQKQIRRNVVMVPRALLFMIGAAGSILKYFKIKAPLTLSRYKSMTTSNDAPMDEIIQLAGTAPYSLEAGIAETVEWMREYHPHLLRKP